MNPINKFSPKSQKVPENDLVRYGYRSDSSPLLYHSGRSVRDKVEKLDKKRPEKERKLDRNGNEKIVETVEKWKGKEKTFDFPFVDTIPLEKYLKRSLTVLEEAKKEGIVEDFKYLNLNSNGNSYNKSICVHETDELDNFVCTRSCQVIAHEVGHLIYNWHIPDDVGTNANFEKPFIFDSDVVMKNAQKISERMRGRIPDGTKLRGGNSFVRGEVYKHAAYRLLEEELFADCYASRTLEPEYISRKYPEVKSIVDGYTEEISSNLLVSPVDNLK